MKEYYEKEQQSDSLNQKLPQSLQAVLEAVTTDMPNPLCPICGKSADEKYKPFCSKRCGDIDLSRWFRGSYAVPAVENDEEPDTSDNEEDMH